MTDIQNARFKLTAITSKGTYSLDRFFLDGDSSVEINTVPSARFRFADKRRTLSDEQTGLIPPTATFWIALSASIDAGSTWEPMFIGVAENYNLNLTPDGERTAEITLYDAPELRYNYITPNQIAIGNCDFGTLFTGTNTATDGTPWNSDSFGNYPNGLLYDTNLFYSSPSDMYGDAVDVPFRTAYNGAKKIEAIGNWLDRYGLCFIVDTRNQRFYVKKIPAVEPFPYGGEVVAVGQNTNQYTKRIDLTGFNSSITLVGDSVFDMFGSGLKQKFVQDTDILSFQSARTQTKLFYSSSQNTPREFSVAIPPTNKFLLGKSVLFQEIDGDSETASVVNMKQVYDATRWATNLTFEEPSYSIAKTIVDITDEIDKLQQEDLAGQIYVRVLCAKSTVQNIYMNNLCAMGFGATFDTDSNGKLKTDYGIETPLAIIPIMMTNFDSFDGHNVYSAYGQLGTDRGNGLIREIVLFANILDDNKLYHPTHSYNWNSRPATEWNDVSTSIPYISLGVCPDPYLISVDNISISSQILGCYAHPKNAQQMTFKMVNNWVPITTSQLPTPITATIDQGQYSDNIWDTQANIPDASSILNMSNDMRKSSRTYSVATFTNITVSTDSSFTQSSGRQVQLMMEYDMPVQPAGEAYKFFKQLRYGFHTWASFSHWNGSGTAFVLLYMSRPNGNADWYKWWKCLDTISNGTMCSWYEGTLTDGTSITPKTQIEYDTGWSDTFRRMNYINTTSGKIQMLLFVPTSSAYSGATLSLYVQYLGICADVTTQTGSGGAVTKRIFERCPIDSTGYIVPSFPPSKIEGVFASASEINGGWALIDNADNMLPTGTWLRSHDALQFLIDKTTQQIHYKGHDITVGHRTTLVYNYPINDLQYLQTLKTIRTNGYIFVDYEYDTMSANVNPPAALDLNLISTSFVSDSRGSQSALYIDMSQAPPYWCNLDIAYTSVGIGSWAYSGNTVGKASFCLNTHSSLREGVDKNVFKTMNVQADWYMNKTYTGTGFGGTVVDDNAVGDTVDDPDSPYYGLPVRLARILGRPKTMGYGLAAYE
jgi:hypothetical protein